MDPSLFPRPPATAIVPGTSSSGVTLMPPKGWPRFAVTGKLPSHAAAAGTRPPPPPAPPEKVPVAKACEAVSVDSATKRWMSYWGEAASKQTAHSMEPVAQPTLMITKPVAQVLPFPIVGGPVQRHGLLATRLISPVPTPAVSAASLPMISAPFSNVAVGTPMATVAGLTSFTQPGYSLVPSSAAVAAASASAPSPTAARPDLYKGLLSSTTSGSARAEGASAPQTVQSKATTEPAAPLSGPIIGRPPQKTKLAQNLVPPSSASPAGVANKEGGKEALEEQAQVPQTADQLYEAQFRTMQNKGWPKSILAQRKPAAAEISTAASTSCATAASTSSADAAPVTAPIPVVAAVDTPELKAAKARAVSLLNEMVQIAHDKHAQPEGAGGVSTSAAESPTSDKQEEYPKHITDFRDYARAEMKVARKRLSTLRRRIFPKSGPPSQATRDYFEQQAKQVDELYERLNRRFKKMAKEWRKSKADEQQRSSRDEEAQIEQLAEASHAYASSGFGNRREEARLHGQLPPSASDDGRPKQAHLNPFEVLSDPQFKETLKALTDTVHPQLGVTGGKLGQQTTPAAQPMTIYNVRKSRASKSTDEGASMGGAAVKQEPALTPGKSKKGLSSGVVKQTELVPSVVGVGQPAALPPGAVSAVAGAGEEFDLIDTVLQVMYQEVSKAGGGAGEGSLQQIGVDLQSRLSAAAEGSFKARLLREILERMQRNKEQSKETRQLAALVEKVREKHAQQQLMLKGVRKAGRLDDRDLELFPNLYESMMRDEDRDEVYRRRLGRKRRQLLPGYTYDAVSDDEEEGGAAREEEDEDDAQWNQLLRGYSDVVTQQKLRERSRDMAAAAVGTIIDRSLLEQVAAVLQQEAPDAVLSSSTAPALAVDGSNNSVLAMREPPPSTSTASASGSHQPRRPPLRLPPRRRGPSKAAGGSLAKKRKRLSQSKQSHHHRQRQPRRKHDDSSRKGSARRRRYRSSSSTSSSTTSSTSSDSLGRSSSPDSRSPPSAAKKKTLFARNTPFSAALHSLTAPLKMASAGHCQVPPAPALNVGFDTSVPPPVPSVSSMAQMFALQPMPPVTVMSAPCSVPPPQHPLLLPPPSFVIPPPAPKAGDVAVMVSTPFAMPPPPQFSLAPRPVFLETIAQQMSLTPTGPGMHLPNLAVPPPPFLAQAAPMQHRFLAAVPPVNPDTLEPEDPFFVSNEDADGMR